jgi:NADPH:quinone reductase
MRGYVINYYVHPKDLTLSPDVPEPTPGPGEVLVDVYSAALNFFDVNIVHCYAQDSSL